MEITIKANGVTVDLKTLDKGRLMHAINVLHAQSTITKRPMPLPFERAAKWLVDIGWCYFGKYDPLTYELED